MAKFKPGDKVRIVCFKHGNNRKAKYRVGDIITIDKVYCVGLCPTYEIVGDDDWIFHEDELESIKDDTCKHDCSICTCHDDTITLSADIPLDDKKEAHRIVHAMVEKAYQDAAKPMPKHESWSEADITLARDLTVAQADLFYGFLRDKYTKDEAFRDRTNSGYNIISLRKEFLASQGAAS